MSGAVIDAIRLTPTHDGQAAHIVELKFETGGTSVVQIESQDMLAVMQNAGVGNANDLIGMSWKVLDVRKPVFKS